MNKHNKIISFITTLRNSFRGSEEVYSCGACYQLYLILKEIFPSATPYHKTGVAHVVTKIGDNFYDINGVVNTDKELKPIGDNGKVIDLDGDVHDVREWKYDMYNR